MLRISGSTPFIPSANAAPEEKKNQPVYGFDRDSIQHYTELWRQWASEAEPGARENRDLAAERLYNCLRFEWKSFALSGLGLTTLPEFPPHVTNVNAENNPLSEQTLQRLQQNDADPDYKGPKITYTLAEKTACQEEGDKPAGLNDITMVFSMDGVPAADKLPHAENKVIIHVLTSALKLDIARIHDLKKLQVTQENIDSLRAVYKWMPEEVAREILQSLLSHIKRHSSQLDMKQLVNRKTIYDDMYFIDKNRSFISGTVPMAKIKHELNSFAAGQRLDYNVKPLVDSILACALVRKVHNLTLEWAQAKNIKTLFLINDIFKRSENAKQVFAEAKAYKQEGFKPLEFSAACYIKKKNLENVTFVPAATPKGIARE